MVKSLKRKVQNLELFKSDLKASGNDSERNEKFDKALKREGHEFIIDDILKWRDEALMTRRLYEQLHDDNDKLKTESQNDITILQDNNRKFFKEVQELRQEADIADEKVAQCEARVQLIEEKLLDERLSHEVEINSLKAMLEKKDDIIAKLMEKGNSTTPVPARGQVRLSPEGIVGSLDNETKGKANSSRSPSPESNKSDARKTNSDPENDNKEGEEESEVARLLAHIKTDKSENKQIVQDENTERQEKVLESSKSPSETSKEIIQKSPEIVASSAVKENDLPQTHEETVSKQNNRETEDPKPQEIVLYEEGTVKEIV